MIFQNIESIQNTRKASKVKTVGNWLFIKRRKTPKLKSNYNHQHYNQAAQNWMYIPCFEFRTLMGLVCSGVISTDLPSRGAPRPIGLAPSPFRSSRLLLAPRPSGGLSLSLDPPRSLVEVAANGIKIRYMMSQIVFSSTFVEYAKLNSSFLYRRLLKGNDTDTLSSTQNRIIG